MLNNTQLEISRKSGFLQVFLLLIKTSFNSILFHIEI